MKLSFEGIEECCIEMKNIVSQMNKLIEEISSSCDSLKSGIWSGDAAKNYKDKFSGVLDNYDSIKTHINKYINSVEMSLSNYKKIETSVSSNNSKAIVNPRNVSEKRVNHVV